jgi:hypothetical protein
MARSLSVTELATSAPFDLPALALRACLVWETVLETMEKIPAAPPKAKQETGA